MKTKRTYQILSIILACVLIFLSVDITTFAMNSVEDVVEIEQEMPEELTLAENEEVVEEIRDWEEDVTEFAVEEVSDMEKLEKLFETNAILDDTQVHEETGLDYTVMEEDSKTVSDNNGQEGDKESVSDNNGTEEDKESVSDNNGIEGDKETVSDNNGTGDDVTENEDTDWGDIKEQDRKIYATQSKPQGDVSLVPDRMWIAGLKEDGYTYTGNSITFVEENEIRLYDGRKLLTLNEDYTLSYKNNKKAYEWKDGDKEYKVTKAPTVIIKGKGNYSGKITKTFVIKPLDFSVSQNDGTPMFQAEDIVLSYNKKVQKGKTKVTYTNAEGKTITLKEKTDYIYTYPEKDESVDGKVCVAYKDVREKPYTIHVEGKGNYSGTIDIDQIITERNLISKVKVAKIPVQDYKNGEAVTPKVTLTYKGEKLEEYNKETGEGHYTLEYQKNKKPGTARVIITGKKENGFIGKRAITFKINGYELKKAKMEGFETSRIYTGDDIKQDKVKFVYTAGKGEDAKTVELKEGIHYEVVYPKQDKVGTSSVVYNGIEENGGTGSVKKAFKTKAYDIGNDTQNRVTVTDENGKPYPQGFQYVKGGVKPNPIVTYTSPEGKKTILKEGTDYKLSWSNNKNINDGFNPKKMPTIKIIGKGNFKGTRQKDTFTVSGSDISLLNMVAADKVYSNKKNNFATSVVITDRDGKKLKAGTDYEKQFEYYYTGNLTLANGEEREAGAAVEKNDIVPLGTILKVVVKGKGNYYGAGEKPATISALYRMVSADIGKAIVKVEKQLFTGKEICPGKSQIVITLKGNALSEKDYEIVSYADNKNKGKGKLTVKGVGDYGGSKTVTFTITDKSMNCVIIFNSNGGTSGSMKNMLINYGKSYNLLKNGYKRKGYKFTGWNTKADGTGKNIEDKAKDPFVPGKEEIGKSLVLYAQWELVIYDITYKLNGGTNSEQNPGSYSVHDSIVLQDAKKAGYAFTGWYTDSKLTKKVSSIAKGSTGNKTLYAGWRKTFVEQVTISGNYLNVWDYGAIPNDGKDDTNQIERAVREASANAERGGVNTVYVPAGEYDVTAGHAYNEGHPGISLESNVNLVMDNEAVLKVGKSSYGDYCVISLKLVDNVTITGGKIAGERYRHTGNSGEGGHGIALYGSTNVEISNISIQSNWGDGIYLGTQRQLQPDGSQRSIGCNTIKIRNCDIVDNRRSNMSITDADNVTIEHCYMADAHGTAPQCGICIEPNSNSSGDRICRNIVIKDTTIKAYQNKNEPEYMCFMTHHNPYVSGYTTSDGIWFTNCTFIGYVGNYSGKNLHKDSKTVIQGTFDNLR